MLGRGGKRELATQDTIGGAALQLVDSDLASKNRICL